MLLSLLNRAFTLREEQKESAPAAADAPQGKDEPKGDNANKNGKQEAAPEPEKKDQNGKQEDSPKEEEVLTLKSIQKGEDGKFFVKRGELIYKGDSPDEVVENVLKGKEEADSYITKLKAVTEKVKIPDHLKNPKAEERAEKVEVPNEDEIYQKHVSEEVRKARIDPRMLNWKDSDWEKYEEENNVKSWKISELRQDVKAVLKKAAEATDNDVAQLNTAFVNNDELESATKEIRELALDSGLTPEDFDKIGYDDLIAEEYEYADKNRKGMISAARLVKAAQLKINKITRDKSPVKKDLVEQMKKGEEAKKHISSPAGGGSPEKKVVKPRSYEEARQQIREGKF